LPYPHSFFRGRKCWRQGKVPAGSTLENKFV
jgi:hypothetical protein